MGIKELEPKISKRQFWHVPLNGQGLRLLDQVWGDRRPWSVCECLGYIRPPSNSLADVLIQDSKIIGSVVFSGRNGPRSSMELFLAFDVLGNHPALTASLILHGGTCTSDAETAIDPEVATIVKTILDQEPEIAEEITPNYLILIGRFCDLSPQVWSIYSEKTQGHGK